jgi:nucleoside-diphosphate-sugar epimerase
MTAARERLGFVPQMTLRQGLEAQVAWQRARD